MKPGVARGYCVGITLFVGKGGELGLYENGLRQNVVFLYQLFTADPDCRRVILLNHGDGEFAGWPPSLNMGGAVVARTPTVADDLDVVIVIGASVEPEMLAALRAKGTRIIGYKGGNGAIISIEAMIAKPPRADAERYFDLGLYDELWMTPQHLATYAGWCRTVYRVPVREVPQIWAPTFIDHRAEALGSRFGYRRGRSRWRVGVMEPNITVMKTSHLAMLGCEAAFRTAPGRFEAFLISNTAAHRDNTHLISFATALSAVQAGVMTFEPRFVSADFLANHCDAIVTHHWQNGLNYLYYEVLYGGYPLIHNAALLRDYGYYYNDFAADEAGALLIHATRTHDAGLSAYRRQISRLVARLDPGTPENIARHRPVAVR